MISVSTPLAIVVTVACFVVLPVAIMLCIKNDKVLNILTCCLAVAFVAGLCICVFATVSIGKDMVKINFVNNGQWCAKNIKFSFANLSKTDVLINLTMLFPLGAFFVVFAKQQNIKFQMFWSLPAGLAVGLFIETWQFILPVNRSVQISDALFNAVSVFVGAAFYTLIWLLRCKLYKKHYPDIEYIKNAEDIED